jgi:6-phosphogluconolactonase
VTVRRGSVTDGEPQVEIVADPDAASRAAAEAIAMALDQAIEARGRADWATTGGSTPIGIYRELAQAPLRDQVPWRDVHVWWGDDRYVPRDHPLSNVLPLDQILLSMTAHAGLSGSGADSAEIAIGLEPGVRMPVENVHAPGMSHAIAFGTGPEGAASAYRTELEKGGLETDERGFGRFDVLLIGVGPDGHLLSVFPGSPLFDSEAWVSAVPAPTHVEPHIARISLNPGFVAAAREPIVVIHGPSKASIVAEVLGEERDERRWPAQLARRPGARWFLDETAAALLPR